MNARAIVLSVLVGGFLTGCTISFSNVSTHGIASDVIDEEQEASPTVSPNIDVPLMKAM